MKLISNKKWDALEMQVKALQTSNLITQFNNFTTQIFPTWQVFKEMRAYEIMDDVYSVVSKIVINAAMIPFYGFNKKDDSDLPDTDKLSLFIETLDFEEKEKLYTFLFLCGEVFAYKEKLDFGVNAGLQKVTFLNPARMVVILSQEFPVKIIGYRYYDSINGYNFDIDIEDMMFIKFFNPTIDHLREFRGLSPVTVLCQRLTRIQSEMDVTVAQLQNGGVPGIVYEKTPGTEPSASGARRDNFGRFLRNSSNKGAPYFSIGDLGYIALGSSLADMDVAALAEIDFDKICNAFGISSILFNSKKASTESNVKEMKKEMFTNTILPNVYRVQAAINKYLVPDIKTIGYVKCDTSDISDLRESSDKQAAALANMYWLTGNEKRAEMFYDQDTKDPLMDKYLVPANFMLLDDLDMVIPPVDNSAGDYTVNDAANALSNLSND